MNLEQLAAFIKAHVLNSQFWELVRQIAEQAAASPKTRAKLTHVGVITADATTTRTVGSVTTTICYAWFDGDTQDAAHKRACIVPVGASVASGQMWLVGSEALCGHPTLLVRTS